MFRSVFSDPPTSGRFAPRDLTGCRVLITGVSGFIGAALARALHARGAAVTGVTRDASRLTGRRGRVPAGIELVASPLATPEQCAEVLARSEPECIVHLASLVSGARELELVVPTFAANLASTVFLMDAAARSSTVRFVTGGSLEEPEGDSAPSSPYAASKAAAGLYAKLYGASGTLEISHARIAMVYGPGQKDLTKLVPHVASSLRARRSPTLTSGRRLADWVYIDDVVEALVRLVETRELPGSVPIGTGRLSSVRQVVETLARLDGNRTSVEFGAREDRANEPAPRADTSVAHEALGWRAEVDLETGLARTLEAFGPALPRGWPARGGPPDGARRPVRTGRARRDPEPSAAL